MRYADAFASLVDVERSTWISPCKRYRYWLRRRWDRGKPLLLIVMLNPSTADGRVDDATIRSCMRLARSLGYGGIEVVNLMAWRATRPSDLPDKPSLAMGAHNPRAISEAAERASRVVCAWGNHPTAKRFEGGVRDLLSLSHDKLYCFGTTKSGAPRHPLYVKTGTPLQVYEVV